MSTKTVKPSWYLKPWYWTLLKVTMLIFTMIIAYDLLINVLAYIQPVDPQHEVIYKEPLGLFAPIFYGFEKSFEFLKPFFHFLFLLFILVEGLFLFLIGGLSLLVVYELRWAPIFVFLLAGIWFLLLLDSENSDMILITLSLFTILLSLFTLFKTYKHAKVPKV